MHTFSIIEAFDPVDDVTVELVIFQVDVDGLFGELGVRRFVGSVHRCVAWNESPAGLTMGA